MGALNAEAKRLAGGSGGKLSPRSPLWGFGGKAENY